MKTLLLSLLLIFSFTLSAQTSGVLTVSASTSHANGNYAPTNIVAIWVEDNQGNFVKTLMAYAQTRRTHLNKWQASTDAAGTEFNTTDAITGATRNNHSTRECTWNATDYNGDIMPDGEYFIWMELTDKNATGNYSSFAFTKNDLEELQAPFNVPSFSDISIDWKPSGVSIQSISNLVDLDIHPNPNNGIFKIEGENIENIEIRSITGKLILKTSSEHIDISQQENGIYLVVAFHDGQRIINKIVKQ
ncbi:MAG: DUF2271 domain-containing protein [Bacteroidales bacterium]|nr:DUF2271 domain-containing protein [Bacteroidales bacterium]